MLIHIAYQVNSSLEHFSFRALRVGNWFLPLDGIMWDSCGRIMESSRRTSSSGKMAFFFCCCTVHVVIITALIPTQISPGQQLRTHIQTDGNDIRPHTVQTHNKRTSTESNLVTAQSTAHEPPENGRKYGPKHVGGNLTKIFLKCLYVF